jgi:glycerol uptake facilitator-like aquaporin
VFCVAAGFFARVIAGATVNEITISYWLIICTTMLSLFLVLAKRRHEQVLLGEEAINHRRILSEYSPYLLDQMIGVVTATTLISYILYTVSAETVTKYHTHGLLATIPFVLYGILRCTLKWPIEIFICGPIISYRA